jgi:HNH endonuclease
VDGGVWVTGEEGRGNDRGESGSHVMMVGRTSALPGPSNAARPARSVRHGRRRPTSVPPGPGRKHLISAQSSAALIQAFGIRQARHAVRARRFLVAHARDTPLITRGSGLPRLQTTRPSGNAWKPTRTLVLARDGYRCQDCGAPANVVDQITPIARGGSEQPSNLQALCAACNSAKGDRLA